MFSRITTLLVAASLFTSCSLKLNDEVKKPENTVNTGSGCLAQAGDVLDRFTNGKLSEEDHDAFYACLEKALGTFVEYADGASKEYFEPGELGRFLTRYFLKGKEIQPGLILEAMYFKRALVGGDPDKISRAELRRIIAVFGDMKNGTRMLLPVLPFSVKSFIERGFTSAQFEDALRRFVAAVGVVGDSLNGGQKNYAFDHLASFVRELSLFLYKDQVPEDHWTKNMLRITEIIRPAKVIFVSPPRDEITAADWPRVFRLAPRYFASFLRAQFYLDSALTSFSSAGLDRVERFFADFEAIFDFVLEQHPDEQISSAEIDDFINVLVAQKMLNCKPETARAFIKAVFGKLLGTSTDPSNFAITKDSLSRFKETFRFGLEGLHAIAELYRGHMEEESDNGSMTRAQIDAVPSQRLVDATKLKNALSIEAVAAVKAAATDIRTVFPGNSFIVAIPKSGMPTLFSYLHMVKQHGLRALNRLMISAYGDTVKKELSEAQLNNFMNDVFPILIELGLVGDDTKASVAKRLFEASLFLYSSDGNKGLTHLEGAELESLVISTLTHAPKVHTAVNLECHSLKAGERSAPMIPGECYRRVFMAKVAEHWSYIPGLAEFIAAKSQREREEIFDRMCKFLRKGKTIADEFSLNDTQGFVLLPYYIELLFSRFDRNGDGVLDNAEGDIAYPVFQPFLAEKAAEKGFKDPKTHKAIFNFLLAYRALPADNMWAFVIRRYLLGPKRFRVDRGHVVEIFEKLMSL